MKKHLVVVALVASIMGLYIPQAFAQATGTVKGTCKDVNGKPLVGAIVEWANTETGRKYQLKTNGKGEYFSLGIEPGHYRVTLSQNGAEIFHVNGATVSLDETTQDFDMQKEQANAAQGAGMTPEELKKRQDEASKVQKENNTIKALNEKLAAAKTASDAGDFDTAIAQLTEATQLDANRDLIWFKLGDAYRNSAVKQTDSAEKSKRLAEAATDYQKAVDLKQKTFDASAKKPEDVKQLAAYYNNLGDAYSKAGKVDDSVKAYAQAAQVNPEGAGGYYYNTGAVLTNGGRTDDAIAAFDKAIAADPTKADAYYQKGVNLVGKAKTDANGKVVAVPGTAEAFNKYLELAPTGPNAEAAKSMLEYIGSTVEVGFGKKKGNPIKK